MKRCVEFVMGVCLLLAVFLLTGPMAVWKNNGSLAAGTTVQNGLENRAAGTGQTGSGGSGGSTAGGPAGTGRTGNSAGSGGADQPPVVVLDAGHGGTDPGKIGINGALEKDINLSITLKTKELLEAQGVTVILTRTDENGLYHSGDRNKKVADLNRRCQIIEESGAAFAVSIHQNSYNDGGVHGSQVFYYKGSEKGQKLADALQNTFNETISSSKKRPAKENASYYMLLHVSCPMVIAECGFLSNWEEAEKLKTEAYQKEVAEALAEGILTYLEEDR